MNRIDRVTAILIQLQSKRIVKAQDIADRFGISLRTVYRDIKTLDEAGIPIIGEAGVGYSIMEGYRLPPVMFTREEATAFLTAEKMIGKLTDQSTRKSYQEAMFKIRSVLRLAEKDHLEKLDDHIAVVDNAYLPKDPKDELHLQTILKSISEKTVLDIGYTTVGEGTYSNRNVEPVGIFYLSRFWYLIGYCRLRNDYRNFRTDRISYVTPTILKFNKVHPSLKSFLEKTGKEQELTTVIIRVDKEVLKYFGEQKYYNGFISQKEVDSKMEMTFLSGSLTGFAKFFLLFGEHADIVTPPELKPEVEKMMKGIACRMGE
jgi:predicted DNA-binding transcriptional regulator YafY